MLCKVNKIFPCNATGNYRGKNINQIFQRNTEYQESIKAVIGKVVVILFDAALNTEFFIFVHGH